MRILHCADLHLDSPCVGLGAKEAFRRSEILQSFCELVADADKMADAMIIAGDLFDSNIVNPVTLKAVLGAFSRTKIHIFLINGNHDGKVNKEFVAALPKNVHCFGANWARYSLGNVVFCGMEGDVSDGDWQQLELNEENYNVVILHGDSGAFLSRISKLPIDYVAMGHYHRFSCDKAGRANVVYSGCLEPRGFDEGGDVGYVVVDTDSGAIRHCDVAKRHIVTKKLDVSQIDNLAEVYAELDKLTSDVDDKDYLNLILTGTREYGLEHISSRLEGKFFALRIEDNTRKAVDLENLAKEQSIRGEFVRKVLEKNFDQRKTAMIVEEGLAALEVL